MKVAHRFALLWVFGLPGTVFGTDWLDERGINSKNLPLAGDGAFIGQLEEGRPGKTGIDHQDTVNVFVQPDAIYYQDAGFIALTEASGENLHAVGVAGVMIANDQNLPGVARQAHLSSSALGPGSGANWAAVTRSLQHLSRQSSMAAINLSWGFGSGQPTGNSAHTLAFDWNATRWNILNIAGGNYTGALQVSFQDNFNGMTIGYSEKVGDTWRKTGSTMYFGNDPSTLPGGSGRTSLDLLAPGKDITFHRPGDPPITGTSTGTSFSAPMVTGTAALLRGYASQRVGGADGRWNREVTVDNFNIPDNAPWIGPAAYRHELMKAVLMNSADKLIDDGTLHYPGTTNDIPNGYLLGMSRTVLTKNNKNWFDSAAFPGNQPHQVFPELIPLEKEMGAGHLNARRAFDQFRAGGYEDTQTTPNQKVPMRAWAVGETTGVNYTRRYQLEDPVPDGSFVSITLAWDRYVEHNDNGNFEFEPGESFVGYTNVNDVINRHYLYLVPRGGSGVTAVARSECPDCTIQHIFQNVPGGEYDIIVELDVFEFGRTTFGLAWWAVSDDGDSNSDGAWDGADIDALSNAIFNNSTNLDDFDMNEDGAVNLEDITDPESEWLEVGGTHNPTVTGGRAFLPGDANLDGVVDGQDFIVWNSNKFTATSDWTKADFNASGAVDGQDFIIWNNHKNMESSSFTPVPEPDGFWMWLGVLAASVLSKPIRRVGMICGT